MPAAAMALMWAEQQSGMGAEAAIGSRATP
jgi:hypothetical protein